MLTRTFDRRTTDPPYNAVLGSATLPDPEPGPDGTDRVRLTVSLRDDPLGRLHARKQIREDQYQAGRHWQALHEMAQVGRVRAVDTTIEPVDGGGWPEPITERQRRAALELMRLAGILGYEGNCLVYAVLGERRFVRDLVNGGGERAVRYLSMRLGECLNSLAFALGYRTSRG